MLERPRGPEWGYYPNEKPGKLTLVSGPQIRRQEDTGNWADDEAEPSRRRPTPRRKQSAVAPDCTSRATRLSVRANAASALEGVSDPIHLRNDARTARREGRRALKTPIRAKRAAARENHIRERWHGEENPDKEK
jgi:hypothetical protein